MAKKLVENTGNIVSAEDMPVGALGILPNKSGLVDNNPELERLGIKTGLDTNPNNVYEFLDLNQSKGEQLKNALVGGGKQVLAGGMDYLATWDLSQGMDALLGNQREMGDNFLHKWASDLRESSMKNNPIYETNPGSVDFGDFAWYMNQVQQFGYSAGMIGTMFLETALLTAATKGMSVPASVSRIAKIPGMLAKLKASYGMMKGAGMAKNVAYGLFSGYREAELNMAHTYDETLDKFKADGYSDDEARHFAFQAASEAFKTELIPSMTLNMAQFAMLGYNPATRQITNRLENGLEKVIKNKYLRGTSLFAAEMGSEGLEEVWQGAAANKGKEYADYLAGKRDNYSFFSKEYLGTKGMWNEFIGGALGGAVFTGVGKGYNKLQQRGEGKRLSAASEAWRNSVEQRRIQNLDKIKIAKEQGDDVTVRELESDNNFYTVLSALHTDNKTEGKTSLYQTNLDLLEGALTSVQANDQASLEKFFPGLDIDMNMLSEKLPEYISDAKRIKEIYDVNSNSSYNSEAIIPITYREFQIEKNNQSITQINEELSKFEGQLPRFNELTEKGKQLYQARANLKANRTTLRYLESQAKHTKDIDEKESLNKTIESLKETISVQQVIMNIVDFYGTDNSSRIHDERILLSIGENQKYHNLNQIKSNIESENNTLINDLTKWKDSYYQSDMVQRAIQNDFDNVTDVESLTSFEESLNKKDLNTQEWKDRILQKRRIIEKADRKAKQATSAVTTKPTIVKEVQEKPQEIETEKKQELVPQTEIADEKLIPDVLRVLEHDKNATANKIAQILDISVNKAARVLGLARTQAAPTAETEVSTTSQQDDAETKNRKIGQENAGANVQAILNKYKKEFIPKVNEQGVVVKSANIPTGKDDLIDFAQNSDSDTMTANDLDFNNLAIPIDNAALAADPVAIAAIEDFFSRKQGFEEALNEAYPNDYTAKEDAFLLLKAGYQLVHDRLSLPNITDAQFDAIYNRMFETMEAKGVKMLELAKRLAITPQQNAEQLQREVGIENKKEVSADPVNTVYQGTKVNDSTTKIAYTILKTLWKKLADGLYTRVPTSYDAQMDDFTDSTPLLDPNNFTPGTKLTARIPSNVNDIPIYIWNLDNTKITYKLENGRKIPLKADQTKPIDKLSFGEAIAKYPELMENQDLYMENVPILLYSETHSKAIGAIHNADWWNPSNTAGNSAQDKLQVAKEGQSNVIAQRRAIIENGGLAEIVITSRGFNKVDRMVDSQNEYIFTTISQQNPNAQLAIYERGGFNLGESFVQDNMIRPSKDYKPQIGGNYYIIPVGKENGQMVYEFADASLVNASLSKEVADSIFNTIGLYISNKVVPNQDFSQMLQELRVVDNNSLREYITQFLKPIPVETKGKSELEISNILNNSNRSSGEIYIDVTGNSITLYKVKEQIGRYKGQPVSFISIPTEVTDKMDAQRIFSFRDTFLKNHTDEYSIFSPNTDNYFPTRLNLSKSKLASKLPMKFLGKKVDGGFIVNTSEQTYADVMRSMFTTNVVGVQASDGTYHSSSQAVINYKLTENEPQANNVNPVQTEVTPITTIVPELNEVISNQSLSEEQQQFINFIQTPEFIKVEQRFPGATLLQAKELFPNNFGEYFNEDGTLKYDSNGDNYSLINKFNDKSVQVLNESRIKIQDVSKTQLNDVINFLTGNIYTEIIDKAGQIINKRELFANLQTKLLDIVTSQESEIASLIDGMTKFGSKTAMTEAIINKYSQELNSIRSIKDHVVEILNYTMDNIQQELNIKQIDRQYQKGDEIFNYEISSEFQNLFDINSKIEFVQYNDNDTVKVRQNSVEADIKLSSIDDMLDFQQDDSTDDLGEAIADVLKDGQVEKNHSKSSLEQDPKQAMNTKVKMLLKTLMNVDSDGQTTLGSFNLPQYNTVDNLWKKLQAVLTNNNVTGDLTIHVNNNDATLSGVTLGLTSDYGQIIQKLQQMSEGNPWITQLVDRLQQSSQSVKNAFCYDMYKHAVSMCKVNILPNDARNNTVKIIDSNSNEIVRVIQNNWRTSLLQSDITMNIQNRRSYKLSVIQNQIAKFETMRNNPVLQTFRNVTDSSKFTKEQKKFLDDFREWLGVIGINLTPYTLNHLVVNGMAPNKSTRKFTYVKLPDLFGEFDGNGEINFGRTKNRGLLFASINYRLKDIEQKLVEQEKDINNPEYQVDYINNVNDYIFNDLAGMMLRLAKIESQYTKTVITTVHNEGGKNLNDITNFNFLTQFTEELKANNNGERTTKLGFTYDSHSLDLQLLETEDYQQQMLMRYVSPESMTITGSRADMDSKVPTLADIDYEYVKLAGLMFTQQGLVKLPTNLADKYSNMSFRMGSMFNPTSSDKDQVFYWKKAIVNFRMADFTLNDNGDIQNVQQYITGFVRDQVITPELSRIIEHHKRANELGENPNKLYIHDGYNYGSQHFMMIPEMNNIEIDGVSLIEYIPNVINSGAAVTVDSIYDQIKEPVNALVNEVINKLVDQKIQIWGENNFHFINAQGDTVIDILDLGYFNSDERIPNGFKSISNNNKIKALAYDFVINNLVSNANYFMMYAGDIANYALDKHYNKKFFELNPDGSPIIYKPKAEYKNNVFHYMMIDGKIDTNLGKRLASMIAPRSVVANSQYDKFNEIVVLDQSTYARNLDYLIELYYGKEALEEAKPILQTIDTWTNEEGGGEINELLRRKNIKDNLNTLSEKFPYLASYMDITSTDGQELTTWREHLDTIMRQGRMDDDVYAQAKFIYDKLSKGQDLTRDELKFVFQPNKPVYNGHNFDDGYTKMIYIKTSSFPLLPQFTKAFPNGIDKVRQYMENIQDKTGRNTRLVYVSGMKAGLPISGKIPSLWNADGSFNNDLTTLDHADHSLILDRKYWGIQQDTPYKSGYKNEDKVFVGTQIMKMLPTLLNKVMNSAPDTKFNIDGKNYSGKELQDRITNMYGDWIGKEREKLYTDLDIDPVTHKPRNLGVFMEKMKNLLMAEAKKRNYSPQDIDSLKLTDIKDDKGNVIDIQFSIPIYFTPNSNKYEGLLNSIISSRMIDLKMPGNSYIVASEEGWIQSAPKEQYKWSRRAENNYEVSSKGDSRFSALIAKLKDGRTIEEAYQLDVKGYREQGNDWRLGKGKRPLRNITQEQSWNEYKALWQQFLDENPSLEQDLRDKSKGKTLTDMFASTSISQARALAELLSERTSQNYVYPDSEMIFTKNWTGKLLPQREVDGKILPAQVICSPKFRLEGGKMLDLLQKNKKGDYIYIDKTDTGFRLKEDMIDSDLLKINSFRIPYSGPQSGPTVEIVGFFAGEKYADLMIVPKNHVTQIGEDFDVDKRYTYQMWNYVDTDGKIKKLEKKFGLTTDETLKAIQSARKYIDTFNKYRRELKESSEMGDLYMVDNTKAAIEGLISDVAVDADMMGIAGIENRIRNIMYNYNYAEKLYSKLLQNEIIKGYTAITLSPSDVIQKEMNKVLSTDESEQQGKILESLRQQDIDKTYGTLLSDEYQKRKMQSGATAGVGIGIYSNALVLHNMIQQSPSPIKIQNIVKIDGEDGRFYFENQDVQIEFGNIITDGTLGKDIPVKPSTIQESTWNGVVRDISDIFNELQNVSTDNEKLQLYGKLGLNKVTASVDVLMTMLGIKYDVIDVNGKSTKISLPHFLISQPIIQDYVTKLQNKQANLSDFDMKAEETVTLELVKELNGENIWAEINNAPNTYWKSLTGQNLYNQLADKVDNTVQLAALNFFLEMKNHMFLLSKSYAQLNIKANALGRSIFDVQNIHEGFNAFVNSTLTDRRINKAIDGMNNLVGQFATEADINEMTPDEAALYKPYMDGYWFKPTTINGHMMYNSIVAHTGIFERFYPFTSNEFNTVFQSVLDTMGYQEMSKNKKVKLKEKVFQEFKKYIFSIPNFGLYSGDIQTERRRLLIDERDKQDVLIRPNSTFQEVGASVVVPNLQTGKPLIFTFIKDSVESTAKDTNLVLKKEDGSYNLYRREDVLTKLSLTSYLEKIMGMNTQAANMLKSNFLLQDFTFDVNINQGMSFMRYRTVSEKNYDQEDIYNAIIDLMEKNMVLDTIDGWNEGKPYTSRDLAEDLIIHAYINQGGVQSAIEYVKNIPVAVLDNIVNANGRTFTQVLRRIQAGFNSTTSSSLLDQTIDSTNSSVYRMFGYNNPETASIIQRQIIQNNPSWGKKIRPDQYINARSIYSTIELGELSIPSDATVISMKEGQDPGLQFVVEYSKKAKQETGKPYKVYEKIVDGVYKEIPTLGNAFIHEYDKNSAYLQSVTTSPNSIPVNPNVAKPVMQQKKVEYGQLPFNIDSLDSVQILQSIAESKTGLSAFAAELLKLDAFKQPMDIVIGNQWMRVAKTNQVVFKKSDLTGTTQNYVASRVMEEMLHAVITPSLLEHFNNNATEARSLYRNAGGQIPDYISNLGSLFLQANKAVRLMLDGRFGENYFTNNLNIVRQIRQNEEKGISNAEDLLPTKATDLKGNTIEGTALTDIHDLIYSVSDIYEFTARLLSNPTLISKLGNVQYSGANKTILQRFKEVLEKFLYSLGLQVSENSIAAQGINQMFQYLQDLAPKNNNAIAETVIEEQSTKKVRELSQQVDDLILPDKNKIDNDISSGTTDVTGFKLKAEAAAVMGRESLGVVDDLTGLVLPISEQEQQQLSKDNEEGC